MVTKDTRKQTRLTFSPLPLSSPASSRSAMVPDRAANVRFQQSSWRAGRSSQKALNGFVTQLPTPIASSQPEVQERRGKYEEIPNSHYP